MCLFSNVYVSFAIWIGFSNTSCYLWNPEFRAQPEQISFTSSQGTRNNLQTPPKLRAVADIPVCIRSPLHVEHKKRHLREKKHKRSTCSIVAESGRSLCVLSTASGWPALLLICQLVFVNKGHNYLKPFLSAQASSTVQRSKHSLPLKWKDEMRRIPNVFSFPVRDNRWWMFMSSCSFTVDSDVRKRRGELRLRQFSAGFRRPLWVDI